MRFNGRERSVEWIIREMVGEKSAYAVNKQIGGGKNNVKGWMDGMNKPRLEQFDKLCEAMGYEIIIKKKPDGLAARVQEARDLGVSYGGLECRRKNI